MARTPSTMVPLGTPMPPFRLDDPRGMTVDSADLAEAPAVVVAFICNHCPFVKHVADGLRELGEWCDGRGVALIAINSNDVEHYPDDAPDFMVEMADRCMWGFPYLFDETQEIARAFGAACTPDFFLFGPLEEGEHRLVYRGQMDDSRPDNDKPVTGDDLKSAITALLAGDPIAEPQKPSIGCNIKWRQ